MRIFGIKHSHDGNLCSINDGRLEFHIEGEKNSDHRHQGVTGGLFARALRLCPGMPDAVAISGWDARDRVDACYHGLTSKNDDWKIFGHAARIFTSSHERSHLLCSYGLSPFPQGVPYYALNYEGTFGRFYHIDANLNIQFLGEPVVLPGIKYEFLFALGDNLDRNTHLMESSGAGRLMALAAFSDRTPMNAAEEDLINTILDATGADQLQKARFRDSSFHGIGVESLAFKNMAGKFSDQLFARFFDFARTHCNHNLPLLIGGGCGLNCEWNTRWKSCGLFPDVFVPPCTNDSGSALGTAIDAQFHFTGDAKISWSAYAGEPFDRDVPLSGPYLERPLVLDEVVELLMRNKVIAWIDGRYEMGPRALGARSLLAAPFDSTMLNRLNKIKQRESYRPIAPLCLLEDVSEHFDWSGPSPHMLFFQKVKDKKLSAISHVDETARVRTVTYEDRPKLYQLLKAFRTKSGYGVLCNTSLNFPRRGFINQLSDLLDYANRFEIDAMVVDDSLIVRIY